MPADVGRGDDDEEAARLLGHGPAAAELAGGVAAACARFRATAEHASAGTRVTLLLCLLLVSAAAAQFADAAHLQRLVEGAAGGGGVLGVVVFVLLFAVAVVLLLPGMLLSIGAGAAYGWGLGAVVAWLGTLGGQVGAFVLGRYLLRGVVYDACVARLPGFAAIDANIGQDGWRLVLLLRLSPVLPYNLMNYGLGCTSVRLAPYVACSALAAVPYCAFFAWLGASATDLYTLLHQGARAQLTPELLIVLACVMILSVRRRPARAAALARGAGRQDAPAGQRARPWPTRSPARAQVVGLFFVCRHAITATPRGLAPSPPPGVELAAPRPAARAGQQAC
ncbi:TVP38/TMEM64 family membrane protein [Scenedesmus sp. PABB004]|nr:TVP38/TMEM64 family membrane protein [Scenedesmus sp. PABB004]